MTAFTAAIDALFSDPNLAGDAVFRADRADPGIAVKVIVRRPDRIGDFGDTRILAETTVFDVRASDIDAPTAGDTIAVDDTVYIIQGEPIRDAERLIWTIEARPA